MQLSSSVIVPGEMEESVFFRKVDSDTELVEEESVSLSLASRNIRFISYNKVHVIYVLVYMFLCIYCILLVDLVTVSVIYMCYVCIPVHHVMTL